MASENDSVSLERKKVEKSTQKARIKALDGIKALAIFGVVVYHMGLRFLPSGHMGVVLFLVLTGFLVTSKFVREHVREGRVSIRGFLVGRLARLWPALAVMVLLTTVLCVIFNHVLLTKLRPDVIPALCFFTNWSYIVRDLSYFDQLGAPSPLTHTWYLGIDMQFCLIWCLLFPLALRKRVRRSILRRVILALALVSAILMAVLYVPDADPSRVYYGLDTRVFALLIGAWLGAAWPLGQREPKTPLALGARGRDIAGAVALLVFVVIMVVVPSKSAFFYRGGMLFVAVLSCAMASACVTDGYFAKGFSLPPLVWLGTRSYSLYLWHYPIFDLLRASSVNTAWWVKLLAVILSLGAAELSYRFVERGPLADALKGFVTSARGGLSSLKELKPSRIAPTVGLVACLLVGLIGLAVVPDQALVPEDAITSTGDSADAAMVLDKPDASASDEGEEPAEGDESEEEPQQDVDSIPMGTIVLNAPRSEVEAGIRDPVMIGDSVPGDAEAEFAQCCPDGLLDAYVGRSPNQMLSVLEGYIDQGVVGHVVILQAFSNTIPTNEAIDEMVALCGPDREIFVVTPQIPESEVTQMYENVTAAAERYDNVHLIDWRVMSADHIGEWLYDDQTHLRPVAYGIYIDIMTNAIAREFVLGGGRVRSLEEVEAASDDGSGDSSDADQQDGGEGSPDTAD